MYAYIPWRISPAAILLVDTRSRCQRRVTFTVFKALSEEGVLLVSLCFVVFQCDLQAPASSGRSKEEDDQFFLTYSHFLEVVLCLIIHLL